MAEKAEIEEEIGKRFADLPDHMQQDEDVPAFLRNRGKGLGKGLGEIMNDDQSRAARAAGIDITASANHSKTTTMRGKFTEACPACNEVHDEVTLIVGDDGFSRYKCPVNHAIVINTPDGLVCESNAIEEDDVVVKMPDAGNRHLSAQIAKRGDTEPITVEEAVRAPIKSSYSQGTFNIIKTAKGRLTKCEERKDELRKLIEESQNELASLTTESRLLRDTIERFEQSSEDDLDFEDDDEDDGKPVVRRRRTKRKSAPKKKQARSSDGTFAKKTAPTKFLKEEDDEGEDDDQRLPVGYDEEM